ncbi:MAG: hypothetical protein WA996_17750, partial [Candidatus Promineifilaceae bacterium]
MITLVNGHEPDLGDAFEIMTFSLRNGAFSAVDSLIIGNGKRFDRSTTSPKSNRQFFALIYSNDWGMG